MVVGQIEIGDGGGHVEGSGLSLIDVGGDVRVSSPSTVLVVIQSVINSLVAVVVIIKYTWDSRRIASRAPCCRCRFNGGDRVKCSDGGGY